MSHLREEIIFDPSPCDGFSQWQAMLGVVKGSLAEANGIGPIEQLRQVPLDGSECCER